MQRDKELEVGRRRRAVSSLQLVENNYCPIGSVLVFARRKNLCWDITITYPATGPDPVTVALATDVQDELHSVALLDTYIRDNWEAYAKAVTRAKSTRYRFRRAAFRRASGTAVPDENDSLGNS